MRGGCRRGRLKIERRGVSLVGGGGGEGEQEEKEILWCSPLDWSSHSIYSVPACQRVGRVGVWVVEVVEVNFEACFCKLSLPVSSSRAAKLLACTSSPSYLNKPHPLPPLLLRAFLLRLYFFLQKLVPYLLMGWTLNSPPTFHPSCSPISPPGTTSLSSLWRPCCAKHLSPHLSFFLFLKLI